MLNDMQKNLLESIIVWHIDAIVENATPEVAKSAFAAISDTSEDYAKLREEFVSADIINEVDELRAYYHHPHVQNRPKDDPPGLLSLTAYNNKTNEPVTADDVKAGIAAYLESYGKEKISEKISHELNQKEKIPDLVTLGEDKNTSWVQKVSKEKCCAPCCVIM